jgi:hypothetical protein
MMRDPGIHGATWGPGGGWPGEAPPFGYYPTPNCMNTIFLQRSCFYIKVSVICRQLAYFFNKIARLTGDRDATILVNTLEPAYHK